MISLDGLYGMRSKLDFSGAGAVMGATGRALRVSVFVLLRLLRRHMFGDDG
jgi:hypothetical protein